MLVNYFILSLYSVCMIVLVVLWLQSGLDKITDFKGNYEWFKGQFSKSPLKGMVKLLLVKLTILELSAGVTALGAIIDVWFIHSWYLPFAACFLSMLSLAALFFGQRMSKEYGGAASLMGYIIYVLFVTFGTLVLYQLYINHLPYQNIPGYHYN